MHQRLCRRNLQGCTPPEMAESFVPIVTNQWRWSLKLLAQMCSLHIWPDTVSVNSAINACAQSGSLNIVVKLLQSSEFATSPNEITLNSAMHVCEKGTFWQASLKFLAEFRQRCLESSIVSTHTAASTCIKAYCWQHALHSFSSSASIDVTLQSLAMSAWEVGAHSRNFCSVSEELQMQMLHDLRMTGTNYPP
eukprot:symbB.v1.2.022374.t1/scaffold1984.1/size115852/1